MSDFDELIQPFNVRPSIVNLGHGFAGASWSPPAGLDRRHKDSIYRTLVRVSTVAFGADMGAYWRDRSRDGYLDSISRFFLVHDPRGRIVGWTGFHRLNDLGEACLFLDSTGVLPELQGTGVMTRLLGRVLFGALVHNRLAPLHLAMRTENPIVYLAFRRVVGPQDIFPNPYGSTPFGIQRLAGRIAAWLHQAERFEESELRIRGAYDNLDALYGELPASGDPTLDQFFRERLQPVDAFVVVVRFTWIAGCRALAKAAAGRSERSNVTPSVVRSASQQ